jgi:hypothetical protein
MVWFFWWLIGVINLHHVPLLPKPYLPYTHRQPPTRGHMPRLALPLFYGLQFNMEIYGSLSLSIGIQKHPNNSKTTFPRLNL